MDRKWTSYFGLLVAFALAMSLGQELPPGPTAVHRSSFQVSEPPPEFEVITLVLDFAPGAATPLHSHGGEGIVLVVEGEMTVTDSAGNESRYGAGESWIEMAGDRHSARNDTDEGARVVFTILLPAGSELTTVHE